MSAVRWPLLAALIVAAPLFAQPVAAPGAPAAATAAPTAGKAPVPKYESAFTGYQPYRDEKLANWRDVNDTAAVLGGHNAHLRDIAMQVTAAGTVIDVDAAAGRVRIDGDGVKELGWPSGTGFWLLKSPALATQVKPGDRVVFKLEKIGDVYRIASFDRNAPPAPKKDAAAKPPVNPHAGHGGHSGHSGHSGNNMGDKK